MTKLHQLKPKPVEDQDGSTGSGSGSGSGVPLLPNTRAMQITLSQHTHVLIMKLGALLVEKGYKPSRASKSAIIEIAIEAMAKSEGLL